MVDINSQYVKSNEKVQLIYDIVIFSQKGWEKEKNINRKDGIEKERGEEMERRSR